MFVNPFAELSSLISPSAMQIYVVVMFILVIGGTILDVIHKKSAKYFFENAEKAKKSRVREVGGGEKISIAIQTLLVDVATSAEFCNPVRRVAHLLKMYGFIIFVISTIILIFKYPTVADAGAAAAFWHLGALMVTVGGFMFWTSLRVDVASEGGGLFPLVTADIFILSLLGTTTFGLLWSFGLGMVAFALFLLSSTVLFSTVLWSKFAHMFFKPAAAFQKRITKADGSRENLPELGSLTDPELQKKFPDIPEYMGATPPDMGLGIKRERPRHY